MSAPKPIWRRDLAGAEVVDLGAGFAASLAQVHPSWRAHIEHKHGRRIWRVAQEGSAPAAAYVRGRLAAVLGAGGRVPPELLERAGAAVMGRMLSRGSARDARAVLETLPAHARGAFDAHRAADAPAQGPLVVAGAAASRARGEESLLTTAGLALVAIAGPELGWDAAATLSRYSFECGQSIHRELTAVRLPPIRKEAAGWFAWLSAQGDER